MLVSRKNLFLTLNYIFIVGILFSVTNFSFGPMAGKLKFIFIFYCIWDCFYGGNCKWNKRVIFIISVLVLYVVLWGTVFKNNVVAGEIESHCIMMSYYLILLFFSYSEISKYRCINGYISSSYFACITVLFIQFMLHFREIVKNPLYIFKAIFSTMRVRSSFGFLHVNYVGNICFVTFILSYFFSIQFREKGKNKTYKMFLVAFSNIVCYFMLISTSSRAAILSSIIFFICVFISKKYEHIKISKIAKIYMLFATIITIICVFLIAIKTGLLDYIWLNSNRQLNVSENLPLVKVIGNIWTGMGFVDNSVFIPSWSNSTGLTSAFGASTSSVDMYYVYLFCSTGIFGCTIIGSILLYIAYVLWKQKNLKNRNIYISIYISILFYAFWESVIFSYRFWSMLILTVLLLCAVEGIPEKTWD